MAKNSDAISISHLNPCMTPDTKGIPRGRLYSCNIPSGRAVPEGEEGVWWGRSASAAGPDGVHGPPMLLGVQADLEVRLHLQPEGVEIEVERPGCEQLARPDAGRRQSQEAVDGLVERAREVGGGDDAVDQAVPLGGARVERLAKEDQLAGAGGADQAGQ